MQRLPLLIVVLCLAACASAPTFGGPLPVRNQHPAQLTVLHMDAASAAPLAAGATTVRADAAYSSLFLGGSGNGNAFTMDGELLRTGLKSRIGLGHGLELRAELAAAHTTGGFLDSFLIEFHDLLGAPSQGRPDAPQDDFRVAAQQNGTVVYEMQEEDLRLLDLPTELSWAFLPVTAQRPYGAAVRVAVEWPTGDDARGFGNGEIDVAIGLVGELRSTVAAITAYAQHTFAGSPDSARQADFDFADVTAVGLGAELALSDAVALLVQTEWETSTLRNLDFARVSDPQWLLWFGLRTRLHQRIGLEFALAEDLSSFVAPDFSAYLALTFGLGGPETGS